MSTTTWLPFTRYMSRIESRRPESSACLTVFSNNRVSQKIDAVSASAIGVRRCIGVRSASATLWYAWPSSCASVDTESRLPSKFIITRLTSPSTPAQYAPPRLPSRISASTHCSANARVESAARSGEKPANVSPTSSVASFHVTSPALPTGANSSHQGSAPSWPSTRALARKYRRKSGSDATTASVIASSVARSTLFARRFGSRSSANPRRRFSTASSPFAPFSAAASGTDTVSHAASSPS